ncbi:MAG: type II secretion system minor pseudopilin GspH [Gammaproteobacteria bacterium]|nr:type II secretion system minor pseudopilin GspH [Gammaproteobacteria bacterium]
MFPAIRQCAMLRSAMRPQAGFTLLELMVVTLMIGVILSVASLAIGDGGTDRKAQQEAKRLQALLMVAGDEAIMRGQQLGILFASDGYHFLLHDGVLWQPHDETIFRPRSLPQPLTLALFVEGLPVELSLTLEQSLAESLRKSSAAEGEAGAQDLGDNELLPQVVILSSGDRTPFELLLQVNATTRWQLVAPYLGVAHISVPSEPA